MTANDLISFRKRFRFSQKRCAKELGCSPRAIYNYEHGLYPIPDMLALACSAVALGLPKYGDK
jgi:transcriptional regulator with XRE-family HTH domain